MAEESTRRLLLRMMLITVMSVAIPSAFSYPPFPPFACLWRRLSGQGLSKKDAEHLQFPRDYRYFVSYNCHSRTKRMARTSHHLPPNLRHVVPPPSTSSCMITSGSRAISFASASRTLHYIYPSFVPEAQNAHLVLQLLGPRCLERGSTTTKTTSTSHSARSALDFDFRLGNTSPVKGTFSVLTQHVLVHSLLPLLSLHFHPVISTCVVSLIERAKSHSRAPTEINCTVL
jgi:hypothetical protein